MLGTGDGADIAVGLLKAALLERRLSAYDESFVRAWRLYLGGCAAAFLASTIQLYQVVFTHPGDNRIPMTRGHLYGTDSHDWDL